MTDSFSPSLRASRDIQRTGDKELANPIMFPAIATEQDRVTSLQQLPLQRKHVNPTFTSYTKQNLKYVLPKRLFIQRSGLETFFYVFLLQVLFK